jgi:hypothetical protein
MDDQTTLEVGDHMILNADTGYWHPCSADEQPTEHRPLVSKLLEPIVFRSSKGEKDGTFARQDVRRWFADGRSPELPQPAAPAKHFSRVGNPSGPNGIGSIGPMRRVV